MDRKINRNVAQLVLSATIRTIAAFVEYFNTRCLQIFISIIAGCSVGERLTMATVEEEVRG